ncbi:hypothetical protein LJC48_06360 [Desulfovibrio sp. OttesenSCG-928-C06]|nr:hypothetical protein [Desulfovibrio sp. OttesenSCG-928-C06]
MYRTVIFKNRFLPLCLAALMSLALFAAPALADDTLVTWEFTGTEINDKGQLKVFGKLINNTDEAVTHLGPRSWTYEQYGEMKEDSNQKSAKLKTPLQPGEQRSYFFIVNDPDDVSNFRVTIHNVTFESDEDPTPPPAQKQTQTRNAADADFKRVKVRLLSAQKDAKHTGIFIKAAVYNNSDKNITKLYSNVAQEYDIFTPWESSFTSTFPSFPPNSVKILTFKAPISGTHYKNGLTDAQIEAHAQGKSPASPSRVQLTDIEFDEYTKPDMEYGPNRGNIMWTGSAGKLKDGKLTLSTTITNNFKEDIVGFNTYTVSFDHADGKYVSYRSNYEPKNPIYTNAKLNVTLFVNDGAAFRNIQNVKISDVTYMSRPVSARPKPKTTAASNSKFSINTKSVVRSSDKQSFVVTVEMLNNSTGQRIGRVDDIAVHYEAEEGGKWVGYKKTIGNKTIDIEPLGTETMKFTFGKKNMKNVRKVKVVGTPRFLDKGV